MKHTTFFTLLLVAMLALSGCQGQASADETAGDSGPASLSFELKSDISSGMTFIGVGGEIHDKVNPIIKANVGDTITITLTSGEGAEHDFVIDELGVKSPSVTGQGESVTFTFVADKPGKFTYYCSIPGHRQAGMEGVIEIVGEATDASPESMDYTGSGSAAPVAAATLAPASTNLSDIVRDPADLPGPLPLREPQTVVVELETIEVDGQLADGTTFTYWTFNGQVPGPFIRVRVGDTVIVKFKNADSSKMPHSVDFHATTGPGGGAVFTNMGPGQETQFQFMALNPGLYVYHCATPMVAHHIANGMYGLILVEPEGGLPPVDREFYVMQGEIYTAAKFGTQGHQTEDIEALLDEDPEYLVFNGAVGALTTQKPLTANTGETVRIFFGVGGPNFTSSFHVIGEIFDRVYDQASLTSSPLTDVQTTLVPPGGATMVEFGLEVPGNYILVDHALSRLQRGLAGFLIVEGDPVPEIFDGTPMPGSGH